MAIYTSDDKEDMMDMIGKAMTLFIGDEEPRTRMA